MLRLRRRRLGAILLALWLAVSLVERAVPVPCALHDGGAAPAATAMAHHGAHGDANASHGSHDGSHQCRCLEQCAASAAFALAGEAPRAPAVSVVARNEARASRTTLAPARIDTRLPFANGPPHALSA